MKILMIGRNTGFVKMLAESHETADIYIIEEPDILRKMKPFKSPNIREIRESRYHQSNEFMEIVKDWSNKIKFDLVLPAFEYSVKPANEAAKYLGLLRIGDIGAETFTNKIKLRNLCTEVGIPCPRYKKICNEKELVEFYEGEPFIFKPANRQGSVGVIRIDSKDAIPDVYKETLNAEIDMLVPDREIEWEYIAESFVDGYEISVECLVKNGEIIFINYTKKETQEGKYFVEIGHEVPGKLPEELKQLLYIYKNKLVKAASVETAVLHSEWKIANDKPVLIECAARMPGDFIPKLISSAYGFDFRKEFINMLCGDMPQINQQHTSLALIQYFLSECGKLKEIKNIEILDTLGQQLIESNITVKPGDTIKRYRSSWDRIGYFILKGNDYEELRKLANYVHQNVKFIVE